MPELLFKWLLAIMIALAGVIRFFYERRYHRIEKKVSYMSGRERWFVLLFALCFVVPGVVYLFIDIFSFASFALADGWRLAGAAGMLLNIFFFLWIHLTLGRNWSPVLEINKEQTLVTRGPYKYMRHPMYLCFFIHAACMWVLTANHFIGVAGIVSFALIYSFRVRTEEQMMIDHFGKSYLDYMKNTGRLFPKLF